MSEKEKSYQCTLSNITILCTECQREVPQSNFTLHRLTCSNNHGTLNRHSGGGESTRTSSCNNTNIPPITDLTSDSSFSSSPPPQIISQSKQRHPRTQTSSPEMVQECDLINLLEFDGNGSDANPINHSELGRNEDEVQVISPTMERLSSSTRATTTTNDNNNQWSCSRCTLLNPQTNLQCDACCYNNPQVNSNSNRNSETMVRPPDQVIRETLIDVENHIDNFGSEYTHHAQQSTHNNDNNSNNHPSDTTIIGGGALLGSLLGGASAYFRGNSVGGGALDGAFSGAVGGALYSEIRRDLNNNREREQRRQRQFQFQRELEHDYEDENGVTIVDLSGSQMQTRPMGINIGTSRATRAGGRANGGRIAGRRIIQNTQRRSNSNARFLQALLEQNQHMEMAMNTALINRYHHHPGAGIGATMNVDQMSYEQLLQIFGDGSENRCGASQETINALPSNTFHNATENRLPKDKRNCCICMEDYKDGEKIKTLPCLHAFHVNCLDRWLKVNASCPVCKHNI